MTVENAAGPVVAVALPTCPVVALNKLETP